MSLEQKLSRPLRLATAALPALNRLVSTTSRIIERWPDGAGDPPEKDREKLVQEMRARVETGNWEGTKLFLVTSAARALFDMERRSRPDLEPLRNFYFDEIKASTRPGFLNAMFSVYMTSYEPGAAHTRRLAEALTSAGGRIGARWYRLLMTEPRVLDPDNAHEHISTLMRPMTSPWNGLKELGFHKPHDTGLMAHAHLAYVKKVKSELQTRNGMERMIGWLKPDRQEAKILGASEAITALLEHWTNSSPAEDDRSYLTQSLVLLYGDPRLNKGGAWTGVPDNLMAVLFRWLTGENIRFFLDVVSAVEDSHMWEPRRKFWLGLFRAGQIDAAWVAFSEKGALEARRRIAGNHVEGKPGYGRQIAGGGRNNTSLLILQIGRRIVVEGSHSYKVHIFQNSDARSPKLYQPSYDCEEIRLTPGANAKSHHSGWEDWVLRNI